MKKLITTLGLIACVGVFSDPLIKKESSSVWQDVVDAKQTQSKRITSEDTDLKRRLLILDEQDLKRQLTESFSQEISLPLPKGGFVRVRVIDSPIFSTDLAESHPDIKTWRIVGVDDPSITGRIDFTPQGFHGMLVLGSGDTVYIDPDKKSNNNLYYSLGKQENHYSCCKK